eukprot:TRINITY_DN70663_c0_g1_i2.p1 TRINITY_DN70663_c0_g1~~TRINITY_DN70663_c0_g1_i2.p1  ORF type:complete len:152 (+),score=23.83 TRINITY_DN70663_c0_g1_i2:86-541(+)
MLRERLRDALKEAMKGKDATGVSTIRLILATLKDRDISLREKGNQDGIDDEALLALLQTMVKQRQESIRLYEEGGRLELADQERQEIEVIKRFMPEQLGEKEMESAVDGLIKELDASSIRDMGRTMAELKSRYAGQMDFSQAAALVRQRLA